MVLNEPADDDLIRRHRAGDRDAATALYCRYGREVYGYVLWLVGDAHAAEDASQTTWLKVCEAIAPEGTYRPQTSFRAWCRRIAHNESMNHLRSKKRAPRTLDGDEDEGNRLEDVPARDPQPDRVAVAAELLDILLGHLDVNQRAAFLLKDLERWTFEEAAEALHVPVGTVMSRVGRARIAMRRYIDQHGIEM